MTLGTAVTQSMEERIDKLDYFTIKNLCSVKSNVRRTRRQAPQLEKIFAKDVTDK